MFGFYYELLDAKIGLLVAFLRAFRLFYLKHFLILGRKLILKVIYYVKLFCEIEIIRIL